MKIEQKVSCSTILRKKKMIIFLQYYLFYCANRWSFCNVAHLNTWGISIDKKTYRDARLEIIVSAENLIPYTMFRS